MGSVCHKFTPTQSTQLHSYIPKIHDRTAAWRGNPARRRIFDHDRLCKTIERGYQTGGCGRRCQSNRRQRSSENG